MRYRITLSYDGEPFCGWQRQNGSPSVQQTVEEALAMFLKEEIQITGAGRTDTGVNASFYVAHFDPVSPIEDCAQLRYRLNAILPEAISILKIEPAGEDFHARFGAKLRQYKYFIHRTKDPFASHSWFCGYPELDFDKMNKAAATLLGTHDFACFEKVGSDNKTSICTIKKAEWTKTDAGHWVFTIEADRFLRNMVRAIVGTLIEVGRGKRTPESVSELLDRTDKDQGPLRKFAGESVPGNALFLSDIQY